MKKSYQLKSNRLNFSKSHTNLNLNVSPQSNSQQHSKQKNEETLSPKDKIDRILNSLNTYKKHLIKKDNQNLGRVSLIFTHENNLSQYKEDKSFMFSGRNILDNQNQSKDNSMKTINQCCDNLKTKPQNSTNFVYDQSSRKKIDTYQLNRIRSQDALIRQKFQSPTKLNQNSQKNILKASSSENDLIFSVQQKGDSLQAIKEKLMKYGIKIKSKQNNKQKKSQKQTTSSNNFPISINNQLKLFKHDSQKRILFSNCKISQILPQNSLDNIKQKQTSFISKLKQSQSAKTINISISPQKDFNSFPIESIKIIDSVTNKLKNNQKKFSLNTKQLITKIQDGKIGQPKLNQFKNNKTSQLITPTTQQKSINLTVQQQKSNSLQKQNSILSLLKPTDFQVSHKQSFDLKQTMQTDYAYARNKDKLSVNHFKLGRQIGKGKFGRVVLATHCETGFLCAMKIIKKETIRKQRNLQQLIRQIKIQSFLNHSNSVKMYGFFDDNEFIYLLIEYCMDGQLYSQLKVKKKLQQDEAIPIIKDVCQGLNYLHGLGIIHRDIKPQNIVLSFGMAKLCDFGWSVNCQNEKRQTFCGTPLYVSPQLLLGKAYDYKVDIWALGILSYELLTGKLPFQIMSQKQLKKIVTNQVDYPNYISDNGQDFIRHLLQKNPTYRNDIQTVLRHKFLVEELQKLRNKKKKQTN